MLRVSLGEVIEQEAITNLLSAHKRIAEKGSASDVIRITKYLLKLAQKRKDVLTDIVPENEQTRCG